MSRKNLQEVAPATAGKHLQTPTDRLIPIFAASSILNPTVLQRDEEQSAGTSTAFIAEPRLINPLFSSEWDQIIQRHPHSTIFHSSAWARVLQETYRYRPFYIASGEANPAALCLFEVNSWLTGRRGVSLPFTDQCFPLESQHWDSSALFDKARQIGKERHWRTLEIRGTRSHATAPASLSFYTHALNLQHEPAALFAEVDASARRAIRKAEKANLEISFNHTAESVRDYYRLHCLTRRKHGLPPQPGRFFDSICRHIIEPRLGFIALAKHEGLPVAGAVFFQFKDSALYKFGASDPAHDILRPNNLLMWQAIQHVAKCGAKTLDFGRTSLHNEGLRRYKLQWGAREEIAHYSKWNFSSSKFVQDSDRSSGFQNRLFRLMPKTAARALGSMLYPHIG